MEENKVKLKEAQEFEAVRERARLEKVPFPSHEFSHKCEHNKKITFVFLKVREEKAAREADLGAFRASHLRRRAEEREEEARAKVEEAEEDARKLEEHLKRMEAAGEEVAHKRDLHNDFWEKQVRSIIEIMLPKLLLIICAEGRNVQEEEGAFGRGRLAAEGDPAGGGDGEEEGGGEGEGAGGAAAEENGHEGRHQVIF